MDSIKIETGLRRIAINDDPEWVIAFDPTDVAFAERFYQLIQEFDVKKDEYQRRAEKLDAKKAPLDRSGLPGDVGEKLAFLREVCEYMYRQIDFLFGEGTSKTVFGSSLSLEAVTQFLQGITPFIEAARAKKVARYTVKGKRVLK